MHGSFNTVENVSRQIRKILTDRAAYFNIALDDVSITSLTFGKEFTAAIEAKQIAAQEAERAKFVVEKAEQDKQSAIIRAQGEAKSAQLIGQAIANNPAFITLRRIEASKEIFTHYCSFKQQGVLELRRVVAEPP
ncbi:UNVERIFIED_CONTAM: Prohibitin-1, mitochondrial [Sesamum calycinum]|uniref:Prohibitin n=1 Tax=Sesamum calycinum TaxID=2727403 RepID=A0AAW2NW05_9LAMI